MIKLSKRLMSISNMITNTKILADIGCDHALLDIYLLENKKINKSIACDITEGALLQARKNIKKSNIKNIDVRLSDGLNEINSRDNVDTIVMSGLGDYKIISILNNNVEKLKNISEIIIQSNTGINNIRKYMQSINYHISNEVLVKEKGIIYTVIKFSKGYKKYSKKELLYGPILITKKDDLFNEILEDNISKNKKIIMNIPKHMIVKKIKLIIQNKKIKKQLQKK